MRTIELPLVSSFDPTPSLHSPSNGAQDIQPLVQAIKPLEPLENALRDVFPQSTEENSVIRTRRILGATAKTLSDEQILCVVTEFQFLINAWLDEFEQEVFNGLTLKEVLNEK